MSISTFNANYQLPAARPVLIRPPGESTVYFATAQPDQEKADVVSVHFPQCPLVPEKIPVLQPTEVPASWVNNAAALEKEPPELEKNPEIREQFGGFLAQTGNLFSALRSAPWEALGPATPDYNCISNTLGKKKELPGFGFQDFSFNVKDYANLYLTNGFLPLGDLDSSSLSGIEKVLIFGMSPTDPGYWETIRGAQSAGLPIYDRVLLVTHGARQEVDGLYSSKFGNQALVATIHPEDVAGVGYGKPLAVFARLRPEADSL